MKRTSILVCAWAALAAAAPNFLLAQNPPPGSNPPGSQGGTGKPAGQTGGVGQTGTTGGAQSGAADARRALVLQPGEDFVGMNLEPQTGARLGRVNDYVIRPNGTIAYVVLEPSSAGSGAHYPIPWNQLQYRAATGAGGAEGSGAGAGAGAGATNSSGASRLVTRFESDRLKGAPSFDSTRWPQDNSAFDEAERYYGGRAGDTTGRPGGTGSGATGGDRRDPSAGTVPASASNDVRMRGSQLRDQAVVDSSGAPIGKIGRVVVDPTQGRVNYVTVVLANVPGGSGRTIAVPWSALRATRAGEKEQLQLNMTADKLANAPQFKSATTDWKEMSDPNWVRSMYGYYSVEPYWDNAGQRDANPRPDSNPRPGDTGKDRGDTDRPKDDNDPR